MKSQKGPPAPARAAVVSGALVLAASDAIASEAGLVLVPQPEILGVLLVLFALLIVPVNVLIFRPIFRVLDAREEKISGTRDRAAKLVAEADEIVTRYEQSIREEREGAERERRAALEATRGENVAEAAGARAEAEREIANARREVAGALADARASLRAEAEHLAREAAVQVLGRPLS